MAVLAGRAADYDATLIPGQEPRHHEQKGCDGERNRRLSPESAPMHCELLQGVVDPFKFCNVNVGSPEMAWMCGTGLPAYRGCG